MRKIQTGKERETSKKRNTTILGLFLLFILVVSSLGYAFITNSNQINPNSVTNTGEFTLLGDRWYLTKDNHPLSFANHPDALKEIPVDITATMSSLQGQSVYIISQNTAVNAEIATVLTQYSVRMQRACYGPCNEDLPEKDCSQRLIIWTDSTEQKVYQQQNCIFIQGDVAAVDAFLYKLLNIQAS